MSADIDFADISDVENALRSRPLSWLAGIFLDRSHKLVSLLDDISSSDSQKLQIAREVLGVARTARWLDMAAATLSLLKRIDPADDDLNRVETIRRRAFSLYSGLIKTEGGRAARSEDLGTSDLTIVYNYDRGSVRMPLVSRTRKAMEWPFG